MPAASLLPVLAASVATAMLPDGGLPPALRLPPAGGVAGNVVVVVVLLAVAVDLGGGVALGVGARRRGRPARDRAGRRAEHGQRGGGRHRRRRPPALAARVVAAALLVLAGSVASAGRAASAVSAALALGGAALVIPAALRDAPPIICAVASLGVVAVSGVLARWRGRWTATAVRRGGARRRGRRHRPGSAVEPRALISQLACGGRMNTAHPCPGARRRAEGQRVS